MGWEHEELTTQEWKVTGSDPTTYDVLVRDREGASPATPELHYSRGLKVRFASSSSGCALLKLECRRA